MNPSDPRSTHDCPPLWVFVGPDKTGSTWLQLWIEAHPEIRHCRSKELEYFDSALFRRGTDWYIRQFANGTIDGPLFQVWHDYLFSSEAAGRITSWRGPVGVVVGIRHPADRAYSSYLYMVKQGRTNVPFKEALVKIPELIDHGRIATHISKYLNHDAHLRTLLFDFDLLRSNPQSLSDQLSDSLGLSRCSLPAELHRSVNEAARSRAPALVRPLRRVARSMRSAGLYRVESAIKRRVLASGTLFTEINKEYSQSAARALVIEMFPEIQDEYQRLDELCGSSYHSRWFSEKD